MHQLTYISSATVKFTDNELEALLHQARDKNNALHVTGMLLYIEGNFIQVLEGEKNVVLDLYETITRDLRHIGTINLLEKPITERNFPDWTMGFKSLTKIEALQLAGYANLNEDIFNNTKFKNTEHPAIKLLKTFYKINK